MGVPKKLILLLIVIIWLIWEATIMIPFVWGSADSIWFVLLDLSMGLCLILSTVHLYWKDSRN